ncbi:hypothetical protein M5689_008218 [Euphorbia peplus]|nr:hypothetical protein M5689_008218 [Euphorbia peplus]
MILVAFIVIAVALITLPKFPVPTFKLNSASVNSFNLSDSHLTAYWDISITIKTTDSSALKCEDVKASVLLNNVVVSSTYIQNLSFRNTKPLGDYGDEKNLRVNLASSNVPINQDVNVGGIRDGSLSFSFNFSYLGTINEDKIILWYVKKSEKVQHVVVLCENFNVVFANNDPYIEGSFPFTCINIHHHH